jgi:hypothetical protein
MIIHVRGELYITLERWGENSKENDLGIKSWKRPLKNGLDLMYLAQFIVK